MKNWLLKEEEKGKVGRPRLADDAMVKKAYILIAFCLVTCFILGFSFICIMRNVKPLEYAYSLTFEKLIGTIQNKNGFIVNESYDKENNFVMEIKTTPTVDSHSGGYKYVL